jgi:hypothetical protein
MVSTIVILLFILSVIIYLSADNFGLLLNSKFIVNPQPVPQENYTSVIEFLTKDLSRVVKDYSKEVEKLKTSRYNVTGSIVENSFAKMEYKFPLINNTVSSFSCDLYPANVSRLVDSFGVSSPHIENNGDGISYSVPTEENELEQFMKNLHEGCWYLNEDNKIDINYAQIVSIQNEFTVPIAKQIENELKTHKLDTYFNRVQAALNFVQHIPYGLPEFDAREFKYFGIALPAESFVLNYSDCDSKSIFLAALLSSLIQVDNIVLVKCKVAGSDEDVAGHHMMVAIKGLGISHGRFVESDGERFLMIETTRPSVIGHWSWESFELKRIVKLQS